MHVNQLKAPALFSDCERHEVVERSTERTTVAVAPVPRSTPAVSPKRASPNMASDLDAQRAKAARPQRPRQRGDHLQTPPTQILDRLRALGRPAVKKVVGQAASLPFTRRDRRESRRPPDQVRRHRGAALRPLSPFHLRHRFGKLAACPTRLPVDSRRQNREIRLNRTVHASDLEYAGRILHRSKPNAAVATTRPNGDSLTTSSR
jgi:hypothetical protein